MSTKEDEQRNLSAGQEAAGSIEISLADILSAAWQRRRWLAIITGVGMLLALGYSFTIKNQYTSTAQLMPPDQQSLLSGSAMLGALSGASSLGTGVGGFMSTRTLGQTYIGVLYSETALDDIINRFDLRHIYKCKFYIDARKTLQGRTAIDEDKKSGIISISVMDLDPKLARDIAKAYVEELDKLVNTESTSSARRERVFLEERLQSIKRDLDASSAELSQFSSRNAAFDPKSQGEALLGSAEKLQAELIAAQSQLSGLKTMYTADNVRVRQAQATVNELQSQLQKMDGSSDSSKNGDIKSSQFMPSIRNLPLLGVTYADLSRRVTVQEAVYETLTKEYELAKVQEAKEIPPVKVLDEPQVAERKSSPHRAIITILGTMLALFGGLAWIIGRKLWDVQMNPISQK